MNSKTRSVIFASLATGTIDIQVGYGFGHNDGGQLWRVERNKLPIDCRMPNTLVWVTLNHGKIESIEKMIDTEAEGNHPTW